MSNKAIAVFVGSIFILILFLVGIVGSFKSETDQNPPSNTITTRAVTTNGSTTSLSVPEKSSNQWIIYSSAQDRTNSELFVSRIDGSEKSQITNDPNFSNVWPRVTPDGRWVYFYRIPPDAASTEYQEFSLWRMNIDGTDLIELLPKGYNNWILHGHVDVSPDGRSLVFFAFDPNDGLNLYKSNLDAKNIKKIHTSTVKPIDPSFTPDGRIVFVAYPPGVDTNDDSNIEIYLIDVDGTNEIRLTFDRLRDHDPAMSPDGKNIAFLTLVEPDFPPAGKWTQRIMAADGSGVHYLVNENFYSANARWVNNDTIISGFFDSNRNGWGIRFTTLDGSTSSFIKPQALSAFEEAPMVGDPFVFTK